MSDTNLRQFAKDIFTKIKAKFATKDELATTNESITDLSTRVDSVAATANGIYNALNNNGNGQGFFKFDFGTRKIIFGQVATSATSGQWTYETSLYYKQFSIDISSLGLGSAPWVVVQATTPGSWSLYYVPASVNNAWINGYLYTDTKRDYNYIALTIVGMW